MLQPEVKEALKAELATGRFKRRKEARQWLSAEQGITAKLATVYSWLGKVGGVLKVPRKTHAKKDAAAAQAFKVELADRMKKLGVPAGAGVRIWGADEHRSRLISVVRKGWTLRGHRPVAPCQTKYQWGHLYAALEVEGETRRSSSSAPPSAWR